MEKINLSGSMIGYYIPFYLNNNNPVESYYQYQFYSPKLSPELIPYISMEKINEKTKTEPWGHGSDVLAMCIGSKKDIKTTGVNYISELLKKEENTEVVDNEREFPMIEMHEGLGIQKSLVVNLRDAIRWKLYRFIPERYVDVLWTPTEFVLFKIEGNENEIWLEPQAMYKTSDIEMKNPLDVDLSTLNYSKEKFQRNSIKISEINRMIKRMEWDSFGRESIVK